MKLALGLLSTVAAFFLSLAMLFNAGWTRPPVTSVQTGYRGTGMAQIAEPKKVAAVRAANVVPEAPPPAAAGGPAATAEYKNIQVLKDLSAEEVNRLMLSMAEWVAPKEGANAGCAYCHNVENLADDKLYTHKVARRMLQMTREINTAWKAHVGTTGVTCQTCHRGQPVPADIWFAGPGPKEAGGLAASRRGQNVAAPAAGLTSMDYDPFSALISGTGQIRVAGSTALPPAKPGASMRQTEATYALMMHMSTGLGVNCTFCHNTRDFFKWEESTPQRVTSWHGIQMVRALNAKHLLPLKADLPANRLGPGGATPQLNCTTCHQGVNKPLLGAPVLKDFPELAKAPQ